jgi:hypothetical protein
MFRSANTAEYQIVPKPFQGRLGNWSTLNENTASVMIGRKMKAKVSPIYTRWKKSINRSATVG